MKKIHFCSYLCGLLFVTITACNNNKTPKKITVERNVKEVEAPFQKAQSMAMNIEGMVCAIGCAATIEKNLNQTAGIKKAKVDFETQKAILIFDSEVLTPNEVTQVVLSTGEAYSIKDFELLD